MHTDNNGTRNYVAFSINLLQFTENYTSDWEVTEYGRYVQKRVDHNYD